MRQFDTPQFSLEFVAFSAVTHWQVQRFPHPRGDGPHHDQVLIEFSQISPPAWGWPALADRDEKLGIDFPTRVGMARSARRGSTSGTRFPHPRGDGPNGGVECHDFMGISPPAWGWPAKTQSLSNFYEDFPTRVGMARRGLRPKTNSSRFPHPRGDGPCNFEPVGSPRGISPPAWGWPGTSERGK